MLHIRLCLLPEQNLTKAEDDSQYERDRAAPMAVYGGGFPSMDEAVQRLFGSGSKAKRPKIRSFALVHEELGDMLSFANHLNERHCLRLAAALRAGLARTQAVAGGLRWPARSPRAN